VFDGELFGQQMVEIVRGYVDAELLPIREENAALRAMVHELERRIEAQSDVSVEPEVTLGNLETTVARAVEEAVSALPPAEPGAPGVVDMEELALIVSSEVGKAVAALPSPEPGAPGEVDMTEVAGLISRALADAVAALPAPESGVDGVGLADALIDRDGHLVLILTDGRTKSLGLVVGRNGIDPNPIDVDALKSQLDGCVVEAVSKAIAALPPAEPGAPGEVDMAQVAKLVAASVEKAVGALPAPEPGPSGVGLADALIDRQGALVLTMSDGSTKNLGVVIGRDGNDGATFTLDDFDIVPLDDGRTFKFCFTRGEVCHSFEFAFPVVLDRGVFTAGKQYVEGDAVTWGGSLWIAQRATDAKPDAPDSGFRLAVKRGRDGKDAR
jgi:hypothetical protein